MSQRNSEYTRIFRDRYETPAWVTEELIPHIPDDVCNIWEPASGTGKMVNALRACDRFRIVHDTDIAHENERKKIDFLRVAPTAKVNTHFDAIITNPPYSHALQFCELAIELMQPYGFVAMLLRIDFCSGKTRRHIFGNCQAWHKKIVLTRRIKWFDGGSKNGPSENHAWYIWDHSCDGPASIVYAPE